MVAYAGCPLEATAIGHESESRDDQLVPYVVVGDSIAEKVVEAFAMHLSSLQVFPYKGNVRPWPKTMV